MERLDYKGIKLKEFVKKFKMYPEKYGFRPLDGRKYRDKEVSEILGVSQTQLYKYFNSATLKRETVDRIVSAFAVTEEDVWGSDSRPRMMKPDNGNMYIISKDILGNFLNGWDDCNFLSFLPKDYFSFFKGECFAFEVVNNEMTEKYMMGGYVITTVLLDVNTMVKGEEYEFQTRDQLLLRTFEGMDGYDIKVSCLNSHYNPQPSIPVSEVVNVFQIRSYVNF